MKLSQAIQTLCLLLLPFASLSGVHAEEQDETEEPDEIVKAEPQKYAFDDKWNLRLEVSSVSQRLARHEEGNFVLQSKTLYGTQSQIDANYGPVGLYGSITRFSNEDKEKNGFRLDDAMLLGEAGIFLEFKPFSKSKSTELRGLSFGLNLGALHSSQEFTLSDQFQSHLFKASGEGAKAGLFVRFYTVVDVYFVLRFEKSAMKVNYQEFDYDEITQYNYNSLGVGYAF